MTHPPKSRYGCEEARAAKCRMAAPSVPPRPGLGPPPWPPHPRPTAQVCRPLFPSAPHFSLFRTRHAEESAERPHLVTVVRPCGQTSLRKVTVLLNRRGVVSFEQLLLDISEALGFPRWHRARVTRLYTTHAREVKGVCDFFRGEMAFLALGKARPELHSVQEALEELFPDYSHYRADALRAWEKKLRPAPDKAAKADSGYSEGTEGGEANQEKHTQQLDNQNPAVQKNPKHKGCKKPTHLPNHLQRLHLRATARQRQPSVIGPFKLEGEAFREEDVPAPTLCESCLARRARQQLPELGNPLSGRVPLPPVLKKQKESSHLEQERRKPEVPLRPLSPQPVKHREHKTKAQVQPLNPDVVPVDKEPRTSLEPPSEGATLSDIERCYELGRVVGDGNFAVVRECRRRDSKRSFAMKIVERSKLTGREHMMQNELSLLGSLSHPHIVRLFAHHHTNTHSYLLMELVGGGDLFEAISDRGKFSEAEAGLMVSDVSDALNYIHCKRIVHRDIKPENLLLERGAGVSRLKLGDFGLAMIVTEPVFTICGTPTYVAPEILLEAGYDVAVDVWALGVILYILLCGFPPFRSRDRDQEELFELIKQGQVHFLSPYWDPISEDARGLVRALLQQDPGVRLTAEQTLLHPWVKAMASACRQGALTHKSQTSTAKPERVQGQGQSNAPETVRENRVALEKLSGAEETKPGMVPGKSRVEDKPPQHQSEGKGPVPSTPPAIREHTPSTSGQQQSQSLPTDPGFPSRRQIQQPGPTQSHADPPSLSRDLHQPPPTARTTELKPNNHEQPAAESRSSTNTAALTAASTQHYPSSDTTTRTPQLDDRSSPPTTYATTSRL